MFSGSNWSRVGASDNILRTQRLRTECILNRRLSPSFISRAALRKGIVMYLIHIRNQNADYTSDVLYFQENLSIVLLEV